MEFEPDMNEHQPGLFDPMVVNLDVYSGPLDLLLDLIREKKMDITVIPLRLICEPYLEVISRIPEDNFERAGEFFVIAATLILIKSRYLLPLEKKLSDDEEGEDPEEELRRRLIEYNMFREISKRFDELSILEREVYTRPEEEDPFEVNQRTIYKNLTLYELIKSYQRVRQAVEARVPFTIENEKGSVMDQARRLIAVLSSEVGKEILLYDLIIPDEDPRHFILLFIAVLEFARLGLISVSQTGKGPALMAKEKILDAADNADYLNNLMAG